MSIRLPLQTGLLLALACAATAASAQPGPRWPASYDLDGNGKITKAEVQTARAAEFAAIDTDASGYASFAEVGTWLDAKQATDFTALDTDGSGSLSQAEFAAGKTGRDLSAATETFKLADTDGDSALSSGESKALRPTLPEAVRLFVTLDSDSDLQISQAEYLTPPKPGKGGGPAGGQPGAGGPGH